MLLKELEEARFIDEVGYHPEEIQVLQAAGVDTTNYHVANVVDWNPFSDERGIIAEGDAWGRYQWDETDPNDGKFIIPWTIQDGYPHEDTLTTYMENLNNNLGRFQYYIGGTLLRDSLEIVPVKPSKLVSRR